MEKTQGVIEKQEIFQKEAVEILSKLNLPEILSDFGKPKIIGSMALGLMTWCDIDIDLEVSELKESDYFQVVQELFHNPGIKRMILSDNRKLNENLKMQGIPASMYLGVFVQGRDKSEWKIDIRFVKDELARAEKYIQETKTRLNNENRKIILEIKSVVCEHPKYISKKIFGTDVYNAVLNEGVKSFEDFKKHLLSKGINL